MLLTASALLETAALSADRESPGEAGCLPEWGQTLLPWAPLLSFS